MDPIKAVTGGSFAPPMDDARLTEIEAMASALDPSPVKSEMQDLCKMMRSFRETPDSTQPGRPVLALRGARLHVPLEDEEVERIWDLVPWEHECTAIGVVFATISNETDHDLRNAAFHLLWFARELCADREPITNDKL